MSEATLFWYDLETSGISPRDDRIMQFAGQRTTLALEPVGEPVNILVRLGDDILPQPEAVLLTGITPQQTLADGVTEVEFLRLFHEQVAIPGTIFVGFNTVRFDDEFMRFTQYRNFYDPYEWQWKDSRGRWDLLDVVRMTRALRPDGMKWPTVDGKPGNRLEMLTKANNIPHEGAHDALADVIASIEVAKLIRGSQPKLFDWLLKMRDKSQVKALVEADEPFVYTSGKYGNDTEKTTVVIRIAVHPKKQGALVYDLRFDPTPFLDMTPKQLAERWRWTRDEDAPARLPIKTMQFNRCPAIAPLSVLDAASQKRIDIDLDAIRKNQKVLQQHTSFTTNVLAALQLLDAEQDKRQKATTADVDTQLYQGFYDQHDSNLLAVVRAAEPQELTPDLGESFHDLRLKTLFVRYKARNYPAHLTDEERAAWEAHRHHALMDGGSESRLAKFMHHLGGLAQDETDGDKRFLLEELQLYAESIMPVIDGEGLN
jgi:exodeoxyribonuclease-1